MGGFIHITSFSLEPKSYAIKVYCYTNRIKSKDTPDHADRE